MAERPARPTRRPGPVGAILRLAGIALLTVLGLVLPASAQTFGAGGGDPTLLEDFRPDPNEQLFLQADQVVYDFDNDVITAVGNVEIFYGGYALFANRVILDRKTNRFTATNGARLEEPDGSIVTADEISLSEDFRDGFARQIRFDTILRSRFAAQTAERVSDNVTVFRKGVYTACYTCLERPHRPPTWQIKAETIVHDQKTQTITYRDATFEFLGVPVAYLPFLSHPDPTVERKSGFLIPEVIIDDEIGVGVQVPYFWALSPSYDLTLIGTPLSQQGFLSDVEWRQRLVNGAYSIRAAGIFQADPGEFVGTSGDRDFRGAVVAHGDFWINSMWQYGFRTTITTDRSFLDDYKIGVSPTRGTAISNIYLSGIGNRNFFDLRAIGYRRLDEDFQSTTTLNPIGPFSPFGDDLQQKQPIVHPYLLYTGVLDSSVKGGQLAYALNLTSLSRQETDAFGTIFEDQFVDRFRGVEGTFTRVSGEFDWRRNLIDPLGQVYTPFFGARGDAFFIDNQDPNVFALEEDTILRGMPYVGIQYRWPWVAASAFGSQTIEPIAQLVVRPDEQNIGNVFNEDAQSVFFEDTSLFDLSRFSGFDRVEGGTRLNVGLRYTVQAFNGGFLSGLFGRSYQLAGRNSYEVPDLLNSAGDSGLTEDESDYVAGLYFATNTGLQLSGQGRFDEKDFSLETGEVQATGRAGPLSARAIYAFLSAKPELGVLDNRQEFQGAASLQILRDLRVFGMLRYDIEDGDLIRDGFGVAYDDDSLSMSLSFAEDRTSNEVDGVDRSVFFRVGLRTLGDVGVGGTLGSD